MAKRRNILLIIVVILSLCAVAGYVYRDELTRLALRPTESNIPEGTRSGTAETIQPISENLKTPWGIAFLPNGDILVTERPGTIKRIAENDRTYTIAGVTETSEGGLLGIAVHPQFKSNNYVYLYSTYRESGRLYNRVQRYTYQNDILALDKLIIDAIPGASNHDGGALAFGPDDAKLYVTTGDAGNPASAQNTTVLSGKILRLNDDGTIPEDNPFNNPVYSYGHRNPQGITWDDKGRLWSTEHGPSGTASGRDELNLIEKGANYGWPVITGGTTQVGMRTPVTQSGDDDTWAPGAITFYSGSLFFTGLRGQSLYQAKINDDDTVSLTRHFSGEYGRLRAASVRDDKLYISTSNTDGRGTPKLNDDKILRIHAPIFID